MQKSALARKNMLDCQLATNGILAPEILEVFGKVPREKFLPPEMQGTAYLDEDLPLPSGGFFMEPLVHARMVQAAEPSPTDAVLNMADMTGYSSAVLSDLVSTVVALESRIGALDRARRVWDDLNYCNIAVVKGGDTEGSPEHAPYDIIFINGSAVTAPETLLAQLAEGGRLVVPLRQPGSAMGCITVIKKIADGKFSTNRVYDAATPYAPGFEPARSFVF